MKLTEDNIKFYDLGLSIYIKNKTKQEHLQLKQQILDDYEKARKWDFYYWIIEKINAEFVNAEVYFKQVDKNQKLRELLEIFFNGDNVMVKKEYKKILERSKND